MIRHRGNSPQRVSFFTRSARARVESSLLASVCRLLGAIPAVRAPESICALPSIQRAELLYQAYETYQAMIVQPLI